MQKIGITPTGSTRPKYIIQEGLFCTTNWAFILVLSMLESKTRKSFRLPEDNGLYASESPGRDWRVKKIPRQWMVLSLLVARVVG